MLNIFYYTIYIYNYIYIFIYPLFFLYSFFCIYTHIVHFTYPKDTFPLLITSRMSFDARWWGTKYDAVSDGLLCRPGADNAMAFFNALAEFAYDMDTEWFHLVSTCKNLQSLSKVFYKTSHVWRDRWHWHIELTTQTQTTINWFDCLLHQRVVKSHQDCQDSQQVKAQMPAGILYPEIYDEALSLKKGWSLLKFSFAVSMNSELSVLRTNNVMQAMDVLTVFKLSRHEFRHHQSQ
jgi:hypothetical protein